MEGARYRKTWRDKVRSAMQTDASANYGWNVPQLVVVEGPPRAAQGVGDVTRVTSLGLIRDIKGLNRSRLNTAYGTVRGTVSESEIRQM